jgi:hypothetical protein
MRIRLARLTCLLMLAASACGNVKSVQPPADAASAAHVCKFDVDRFDAACVFAP